MTNPIIDYSYFPMIDASIYFRSDWLNGFSLCRISERERFVLCSLRLMIPYIMKKSKEGLRHGQI